MNSGELVKRLQVALQLEYSMIVHYPRIATSVHDPEIQEMILKLGKTSVDHANVVASTIESLGSTPHWSIKPFPEETDMVKLFEHQLELEKLAHGLHEQNSRDVEAPLRGKFEAVAEEETRHIEIVKEILSRLKSARTRE